MSRPGTTFTKDPDAELVYTWDWSPWLIGDAEISTSTFLVSEIAGDGTPLESENASIVNGTATKTLLTGGTRGQTYTVTNRVVTDESPQQTDDRSIRVTIQQR